MQNPAPPPPAPPSLAPAHLLATPLHPGCSGSLHCSLEAFLGRHAFAPAGSVLTLPAANLYQPFSALLKCHSSGTSSLLGASWDAPVSPWTSSISMLSQSPCPVVIVLTCLSLSLHPPPSVYPQAPPSLHPQAPRGLGLWLVHLSIPSTSHGAEQAAGTQGMWSVACAASRMGDRRGQEQSTAWGQGLGHKGKWGLALPLATGAVGAKGRGASLPPSLSVASRGLDGACASHHADFRTGKAPGSLCRAARLWF